MTAPVCSRIRPRGFTLVELITVVAILGILVTLTVGAVQGVQNYVSRKATEEAFSALDSALQRYYVDWGKYPYTGQSVSQSLSAAEATEYGLVRIMPVPGYAPLNQTSADQQTQLDAMLYAALTMTERGGPYYRGSQAKAGVFRLPDGTQYRAFADGWGREIRYMAPTVAQQPPATRRGLKGTTLNWYYPGQTASGTPVPTQPVLESLGPDEAAADDNLVNYGYISDKP